MMSKATLNQNSSTVVRRKDDETPVRPAYELNRRDADTDNTAAGLMMMQMNNDDAASSCSEAYLDIHTASGGDSMTVITAAHIAGHDYHTAGHSGGSSDATNAVHEMHLALLYLLSNPEEFEQAIRYPGMVTGSSNTTTLAQWNAEYADTESLYTADDAESVHPSPQRNEIAPIQNSADERLSDSGNTPLPYAVFCDDAEVVLPQAHTASQLFGLETVTGMELEAAAGVPAISQLFLRWLALMPGGDHLNLIDPPGLTVMPIAGGRYRVTAAHRVVWTWMNEFAPIVVAPSSTATDTEKAAAATPQPGGAHTLQVGDLVSMTIVDVFESDNQGKLLSYCPTFDNRAVMKTDRTAHAIRKQTGAFKAAVKTAQNSKLARALAKYTGSLAQQLQQRVSDAVQGYNSNSNSTAPSGKIDRHDTGDDAAKRHETKSMSVAGTSMYLGDDDMERHEV